MPEGLVSTGAGNYLEVRLTATDSNGLSKTVTRDVQPNRVDVSFATNPSGLSLLINGETFTTPKTLVSWEGYSLNVNAPSPQTLSGKTYVFSSWSDGKGQATRHRYRGNAKHLHGHLQEPAPRVEPQQLRPLGAPQQRTSSAAWEATTPSRAGRQRRYFLAAAERTR